MPDELIGKVAIVTGASQGLGRGFAIGLAQAGADVVLAARTQQTLAAVSKEVSKYGRRVIGVPTDVTEADDVQKLIFAAQAQFGRIDILLNNAGGHIGRTFQRAPLMDLSEHDFDECMDLNLKSVFLCGKAVAPFMKARGQGVILNVSSGAGSGEAPRPGFSAYGAAKAAVQRLTECMAAEWGPEIRVNCLIPGFIDNPKGTPGRTPAAIAERLKGIAMGRVGQNEDLVGAAVFLASDAASWITGASLAVDGGKKSIGPSGLPASGAGITRS